MKDTMAQDNSAAAVTTSDEPVDRTLSPPDTEALAHTNKSRWERLWPSLACGAGLFSDGYLNGVIGQVNTMLSQIYGSKYSDSAAYSNVASIVFAGTVVGMLIFGYTSDHYSRKWSLMASTIILIIFAALAAGAWGAHHSLGGMLAALTAYRFLLGIGIGGEYPAGSVACAESSGELKAGTRNRWFILFTNVQIDFGFVISAFVPLVLVWICGEDHLRAAWRISLGLGVIPPMSLFYLRLKLQEPEAYKRETMKRARTPWLLVIKYYWWRLFIVSAIWFIYDFSAYSFGIYSSKIVDIILGSSPPLWKSFGWTTVIYLFYMPGCILGSFVSDWIGPRATLAYGVLAQAIVGFIMAGCYNLLATPSHVAGFVVVYGIFLSLGELGPGDNIGLAASKTCATSVRGQYYAIAAALGKVGAFVGTKVFPIIISNAPNEATGGQHAFWVSSSLCVFSAFLAFFCLPHIAQDTIVTEDIRFREYLLQHGYDTSKMGVVELQAESVMNVDQAAEGEMTEKS
ncbi:MFS general substrate transporter [Xylona heveae TC161]|uniref:MFS general substrate transporter n=1 Tax=Xylona heveae (strain CBS 132557 / TC161) TaxID=1328760 RepID=A0A165FII9_XYLHT|nr:MFS general substrate transporter [Xylona heveae TC161]KZF21016.1 MFS general substrate transporter [Xylona heveae TC161]